MSDCEFWLTVRRALVLFAHAIRSRYHFAGLVILLTGKIEDAAKDE